MSQNALSIETQNLTRVYRRGCEEIIAVNSISLTINKGDFVSIIGPSGSGKTTLINLLGCLDNPTSGKLALGGRPIFGNSAKLSEHDLTKIRRETFGYIFQNFYLIPTLTVRENVMLPLTYAGVSGKERTDRAMKALERVGLSKRTHHAPNELSGGQQQRVAIARALVNEPAILLADEPTGALDSKTSVEIMELFQKLHSENGQTVILVTHDSYVARHTNRIIKLSDGRIVSDEINPTPIKAGAPRVEA